MLKDLAWPASILLLKFVCKLFIDQNIRLFDVGRALISFPIDIIFLSFSFGSALLYAMPSHAIGNSSIKNMFMLLVLCMIIIISIIFICRRSDAAFTQGKKIWCSFLFFISYVLSAASILCAVSVRSLI